MTDLIFSDEDRSFQATFRTDLIYGNDGVFTVMDIIGLGDAEKATGLDFNLEENDLGNFKQYAQDNNLRLEADNGRDLNELIAVIVLNIVTQSLPDGATGTNYSQTVGAEGGIGDLLFSVSSGALPSGLDLNEDTGEISGTPDTVETANFDITVSDDAGNEDTQSLSINIA